MQTKQFKDPPDSTYMVDKVASRLNSKTHALLQHPSCPQRPRTRLVDTLHPL